MLHRLRVRWRNRKYHGIIAHRHPNGQLQSETPWRFGVLHGTSRTWYANGQLNREATYRYGKRVGCHRIWSEDGSLWRQECFVNDKAQGKTSYYDKHGRVVWEYEMERGERHGREIKRYDDIEQWQWLRDRKHGPYTCHDAKSRLRAQGQFVQGKKFGLWSYWSPGESQQIHYPCTLGSLLPGKIAETLEPAGWLRAPAGAKAAVADALPFEPMLVWGDFAGDGQRGYAVKIAREGGDTILAYVKKDDAYAAHVLEEKARDGFLSVGRKFARPSDRDLNDLLSLDADCVIWCRRDVYVIYRFAAGRFVRTELDAD